MVGLHSVQTMAVARNSPHTKQLGPERDHVNRFEAEVRDGEMIASLAYDQRPGAAAVDYPAGPTELLIFGNARGGTPLMELVQRPG